MIVCFFFFQAEDGIRDLVRSRGLGDVYKRQRVELLRSLLIKCRARARAYPLRSLVHILRAGTRLDGLGSPTCCLLYTSDAADERSSVDLGGRRILNKKKQKKKKKRVRRHDKRDNL